MLKKKFESILRFCHLYSITRGVYGFTRTRWLKLKYTMLVPIVRHRILNLETAKKRNLKGTNAKIRVYFIAINEAQWVYQSIYDAMEKNPCFEPTVLVCPEWVKLGEGANEKLKNYFKLKGMRVVDKIDDAAMPDVVFFPNINAKALGGVIKLKDAYSEILCCTLYYSMGIDNSGAYYVYQPDFMYAWRQYVPVEFYKQLATKFGLRHGDNVVCSGSPKSDLIYASKGDCAVWKDQAHKVKRIIYAPHWSILTHGRMSNFDRYYDLFYNYLKDHNDVEIVLKPHPLLRPRLTSKTWQERLMAEDKNFVDIDCLKTEAEYDAFIAKWCSLPNASHMDAGDYNDLFVSSDAMILDSVSFMAEYMVLNKPMCFCVRDSLPELQNRLGFNEFGKDLQSAMTIADDWDAIVEFIKAIVKNGDDGNLVRRTGVIEKYLAVNRGHVGEFITNDIENALRSKND